MKPRRDNSQTLIFTAFGLIPVVWAALLAAPVFGGNTIEIIQSLVSALNSPLDITICANTLKAVLVFIGGYALGIGIYFSTRRNTRFREEHGSAKWGSPSTLCRKYGDRPFMVNKILTQNVRIGFNTYRHRHNLNVLVIGGSGSSKTRGYGKPNVMNANCSMVILDPKGEIARDTGFLLKAKGYEVKVLDLINMEKSHCFNPFQYLDSDNDVQRLVTNFFKSTTPKNSSTIAV